MVKKPLSWGEQAQRISDGQRFYVDKAQALVDEMEDVGTAVDELVSLDATEAVETLKTVLDLFGQLVEQVLGMSSEVHDRLTACVEDLADTLLPIDLNAFAEALERAKEGAEEVAIQRDDPSGYLADERRDSREQAQEAFGDLAEVLAEFEVSYGVKVN